VAAQTGDAARTIRHWQCKIARNYPTTQNPAPPARRSNWPERSGVRKSMTKNKMIESLSASLQGTARWRAQLSDRDPRYTRAARNLSKLASEASSLSDQQWAALEPHFESARWAECVRAVSRLVGYKFRKASFPFYIRTLKAGNSRAYRKSVFEVHRAMTKKPDTPESRVAFRNLIDSIVVHPTAKRMPYEFTPYARIAAIQGLNLFPPHRTTKEVIDAQGLSYSDITNTGKSVSS
jgi:hypothetical protein